MPYTRVWSDNVPLGAVDAKQIDNEMRARSLDIHERMDTLLGAGAWLLDPVVTLTGFKVMYPAVGAGLSPNTSSGFFRRDGDGLVFIPRTSGSGTILAFVPIYLPVGVTITKVEALVVTPAHAAGYSTMTVYRSSSGLGTPISAATAIGAGVSGVVDLGLSANESVLDGNSYCVILETNAFSAGNSDQDVIKFKHAIVTYTKPHIVAAI